MRSFMSVVKTTGNIPGSHKSHDHLNEQKDVPLNIQELEKWKQRFAALKRDMEQREGVEVVWGLVDGFLLYWDPVRLTFPSIPSIPNFLKSGSSICVRHAPLPPSTIQAAETAQA